MDVLNRGMRVDPLPNAADRPHRHLELLQRLPVLALAVCLHAPVSAASPGPSSAPESTDEPERPPSEPAKEPQAAPSVPEALGDEPADPNDEAFLRAPNGQLQQWSRGAPHGRSREFRSQRYFAVTGGPIYSVLRWPFVGRGNTRVRGAGAHLELDARILRFLWARLQASYAAHPVEDLGLEEEDGSLTPIARAGRIDVTQGGLGLVYALDLGRFLPLVDVGAGLLWLRTPDAVQDGQRGGACAEGGGCETGLQCSAANICEPVPVPMVNAGMGIDILMGQHWHVGLHVRYFALLSNPSDFPVYYTGAIRVGARF